MMVSMSEKEFSRLGALTDVQERRLRVDDAAQLLKLKRRQIFRLLKGIRTEDATSLASKRRGRPSNNKLPTSVRELMMTIVKERYSPEAMVKTWLTPFNADWLQDLMKKAQQ